MPEELQQEKPVREKRTLNNSSRLRAFQADAGVWAVLFELVKALRMFMKATAEYKVQDFTLVNSARAKATEVLKDFPDEEYLG